MPQMILVKDIGFAFMYGISKNYFLFPSQMKRVKQTWFIFFAG